MGMRCQSDGSIAEGSRLKLSWPLICTVMPTAVAQLAHPSVLHIHFSLRAVIFISKDIFILKGQDAQVHDS